MDGRTRIVERAAVPGLSLVTKQAFKTKSHFAAGAGRRLRWGVGAAALMSCAHHQRVHPGRRPARRGAPQGRSPHGRHARIPTPITTSPRRPGTASSGTVGRSGSPVSAAGSASTRFILQGAERVQPLIGYSRTRNVVLDAVELWVDDAYAARTYPRSPRGIDVPIAGEYRITSTASPAQSDIPQHVLTAAARVYAYLYHHAPARQTDEFAAGVPPNLAGAVLKSGAAQLLTQYRRVA